MTSFARLGACAALLALVAAFGCEAIVNGDVPAYSCSSQQYVDPGMGSCPSGEYCLGSGCSKCEDRDICDGYDNDCNGKIDDGPFSDHDDDGYTVCGQADPQSGKFTNIDCNDDDPTVHPGAKEVCNGKDDDCDGVIDNPDQVCPGGQTCVPKTGQCIGNEQVCSPLNCPAPKVCDSQTQQCVLPNSQDAGSTGCTSDQQCTTGICATGVELGPGQPSVCTQPCCTSSDCAAGYVCFGPGTGGNYCVAATSVNRPPTPGASPPGATCGRNEDCRSGVCAGGQCEDTCCNDGSCTNGTACSVTTISGATTFGCIPPPGAATAYHSCNGNTDCTSGYCQQYKNGLGETVGVCIPACCSSYQCGTYATVNQFLCYDDYAPAPSTSGPVVPVCDYLQPSDGPAKGTAGTNVGDPCTRNSDCYTNRCLTFNTGKFCSDVCCVDADCNKPGWACRPIQDGPGTWLRCVPPQ